MSEKREDVPMVPKHWHQAEMAHMTRAVKIIALVALSAFVSMVIMAYIFVSGYTSRTKDILNTINNLKVYSIEDNIHGQEEP